MRRACTGRSDACAPGRHRCRTYPRVQHGVPPRRAASIGGFNPVFVRAGDDVDVCWRLARDCALASRLRRSSGITIGGRSKGFGASRPAMGKPRPTPCAPSGEVFSGRTMWRGRIYSPFPGDARRPWASRQHRCLGHGGISVGTGPHSPWQHLPHSVTWMVLSTILIVLGAFELAQPFEGEWLLGAVQPAGSRRLHGASRSHSVQISRGCRAFRDCRPR